MTLFKSGSEQYAVFYVHYYLTANREKRLYAQFSLWPSFGEAKIGSLAIGGHCPIYRLIWLGLSSSKLERKCVLTVSKSYLLIRYTIG